ncbi:hypothetical protein H0H87_002794 [Tephrocybe sp. NHM501043]|nr:hypothetical protein H0H87_002794 [Tephrocybe sp. NHM501043]
MSFRPLSSLRLARPTLLRLTSKGYTTLQDLQAISPEILAQGRPLRLIELFLFDDAAFLDLLITLSEAETILSICQNPTLTQGLGQPALTQSAAFISTNSTKMSTGSPPVDHLLSGGLSRGQIVEISGPPGTPKEALAISIVKSFVEAGHETLFIASGAAPPDYLRLIYHYNVPNLSELMVLIYNLPKLLNYHPKAALLVVNSISFPFQAKHDLSITARNALLEKIKQAFTITATSHTLAASPISLVARTALSLPRMAKEAGVCPPHVLHKIAKYA